MITCWSHYECESITDILAIKVNHHGCFHNNEWWFKILSQSQKKVSAMTAVDNHGCIVARDNCHVGGTIITVFVFSHHIGCYIYDVAFKTNVNYELEVFRFKVV